MSDSPVDLKKTVNLPKTAFPMKANLPQNEPKLLERWDAMRLYHRIREARAGQPLYVLHDGPPYANGNIHLGHALNKLLKDFIVKSKTMSGFDSPYVPGWDCHGLPIEIKVDGELGPKKAQMTQVQIRQACRRYAEKYVRLQSEDFQRLAIFGRWEQPYLTMDARYQSAIARAFVDFLDQGYVYKGLKPVNWCIHCKTTLAEAEVEYENHTSPSIYVRFKMTSQPEAIHPSLAGKNVYAVIWTTTPWTIPANLAISFHPKFEYVATEVNGDVYIVAQGLLENVTKELGWPEPRILGTFDGSSLDKAVFRHPFLERDSLGLVGDHVTLEQGTGEVHTAPGHGMEDFQVCQQYGIAAYCPVDAAGRFFGDELPADILGKTVWEANPIVIRILEEHGALLAKKNYQHQYPHCWRCHNPTIFRGTEQWFIGMEKNNLRQNALDAIKNVKWLPAWGEERISNMIATRPDWVISRQRTWGVPITVFYCDGCNAAVTDKKVLDPVVDRFAKESADVWYAHDAKDLLPEGFTCPHCGGNHFRKEMDILDVWFDSGASHLAVLTKENNLPWPSDVYLEGGDQYRGWFHSSLLVGVGLRAHAPYRACVTNGWTLDGEGRAMSKSLGNVIAPEEVIKQFGAEVIRLWVSSVEFNEDVRLSPVILERLAEAYRKIRNTFRYSLGNLDGFDPATDSVDTADLEEIDQWILWKTSDLVEKCRKHYDDFAFHRVYQAFYNFCTVELSAIYFDILKDRLYTSATRSQSRRSAQTALYRVTHALLRLAAPILAFTSEEAWTFFPRRQGDPDSIHLALFPTAAEVSVGLSLDQQQRLANWDRILGVRETVLKSLEQARQDKFIGAPLEAKVVLEADPELYPLLQEYSAQLPGVFITSQVEVSNGAAVGLAVRIEKAEGVKCERCWKYKSDIGHDPEYPTACASCAGAVKEILLG
jgi:isoleucyl-tRNA synthetase